ncbi:nitroreductase family protein [Irregularibacter muris]|uniref:Nitroreductase family protein n=1 Tax=Irregularibacter muris TaxID=1796619 RepID=A0AAE3KZ27_9FIRM|nr:nitroreductase family protein [Irregularibacter muris]MCR1898590.1 nitroreductase family protein [Irregularibacter muris]
MLELLRTRRSIRRFMEREVEEEKIQELLQGALMAPSSKNRRPWELIVVKDKEILNQLSQCRGRASGFMAGAALGVVVLGNPEASDVWVEDCSIVATILQLQAHFLGLGSCWIQVRKRETPEGGKVGDYLKEVLSIPQKYDVECMIALGYPAQEAKPHDKDQLSYDKIHYNNF